MYKMTEACKELNISYETLKYYCNVDLVPNLKRDANNYRIFDQDDIIWLKGVIMLRKCGMSINDIKTYLKYALLGEEGISYQQEMLEETLDKLNEQKKELDKSIDYIHNKQQFYKDVKDGKIDYYRYKKS